LGMVVMSTAHSAGEEPLAEALEKLRSEQGLPALAVASIQGGKILESGAVGVRRLGGPERVTVNDLWHIGSCTKSMTSALAAMLVERGKITWTTTVGSAFPELQDSLSPQWKDVTLTQLLSHRSGAPGNAPKDLWAEAKKEHGTPSEQRETFVKGLLQRAPEAAPGSQYIYSNQGYTIAGVMLERVAHRPWEEMMRTEIFAAAGMQHAGFGAPAKAGPVEEPWGHLGSGPTLKPFPPGPGDDNPPSIGPAGTMHCSIEDFARYAWWQAHGDQAGQPTLQREGFVKVHTPAGKADHGMGWVITSRPWAGGTALWHNGSNTMFYAIMWLSPAKDAAFVAATNCAGDEAGKACEQAVWMLIQRWQARSQAPPSGPSKNNSKEP